MGTVRSERNALRRSRPKAAKGGHSHRVLVAGRTRLREIQARAAIDGAAGLLRTGGAR